MATYSELKYVVPPRHRGQNIELAFAVTPDELVRRTTNNQDGSVKYETADLCSVSGKIDTDNRTPSVPHDAWDRVDGNDRC